MRKFLTSFKFKVLLLVLVLASVSFYAGWFSRSGEVVIAGQADTDAVARGVDMTLFWRVWDTLDKKYVYSASTTVEDRLYGAIKGLASSYNDDYTEFMPPEKAKEFNADISGSLEGVGMEVGMRDNYITVVSPIKDSPAFKAGVQSMDRIMKINDTSTDGLTADQAVKLIRGKKGTEVTITFSRTGVAEPIVKKIIRDVINIPTIDTSLKTATSTKDNVFVIQLYSFNAQSPALFRKAIKEFLESGSNKLVLDLRNNPGGYLDAATDMASFFLEKGKVIVSEDFGGKGKGKVYNSAGYDIFKNYPIKMVVLINGGSASASEILAGALHDNGLAKLVGVKSFGKGSVQELIKMASDTSLKVTIAKWMTPNGINISKEGITPDFVVENSIINADLSKTTQKTPCLVKDAVCVAKMNKDGEIKVIDAQMDKALEILRK